MNEDYYIVGIDEVGRGPVAGPVAVGAVAYKRSDENKLKKLIANVNDSKKLSEKKRESVFEDTKKYCNEGLLRFCVAFVGQGTIDSKGISYSLRKALDSALIGVNVDADTCEVLLDGGLNASDKFKKQKTIIGGDGKEFAISLASIVAKVSRDKKMLALGEKYPLYGFEKHKGYGTREHMENIKKHGMSKVHRISFLKKFAQ